MTRADEYAVSIRHLSRDEVSKMTACLFADRKQMMNKIAADL